MRKIIISISVLLLAVTLKSQIFTEVDTGLPNIWSVYVAWGDYNNDGNKDILLSNKIYRNNGNGTFIESNVAFNGVSIYTAAWGDYDNDGNLDILINGYIKEYSDFVTRIYRNNGDETFTDIKAGLKDTQNGYVAWGDYNNDGWLDIMLSDDTSIKIYKNNEDRTFTNTSVLTNSFGSSVIWADLNNDSYLDIIQNSSIDWGGAGIIKIYLNNGDETFSKIETNLVGGSGGSVDCGDYNNDGWVDILVTGRGSENITKIYQNNGGSIFTDISAGLPGIWLGEAKWGDYDNDGYLDVISTGSSSSKIYHNNRNGTFTDIEFDLPDADSGWAGWCDYDNDNKLDFLITGRTTEDEKFLKIFRNNATVSNSIPTSPTNLSSSISGSEIILSWSKSTDSENPQNGLNYNIYIGLSPQNSQILDPMSLLSDGFRKVTGLGNSNNSNLKAMNFVSRPSGTYYWSVQAVDHAYAGSLFSTENSFYYSSPLPEIPVANEATAIDNFGFTANWNTTGDKGYYLDIAYDSLFTNFVLGYENKDMSYSNHYSFKRLESEQRYFYRIRAYNGDGVLSGYSNVISVETLYSQFAELNTDISGIAEGSVAWGDYNNDGLLDILLTGYTGSDFISRIYRNNGDNSFTDIEAGLKGIYRSSVTWGDFDNDNFLDIFMTGHTGYEFTAIIYRNNGNNTFTEINTNLPVIVFSSVALGAYDNDGYLDIFISGYDIDDNPVIKIFRNNGDISFTEIPTRLPGVVNGSTDWGDYDNDGDLDIILAGYDFDDNLISKIFRNNGDGTFSDINAMLPGVFYCNVSWGDYDNDGYLDILLTGYDMNHIPISKIYRNNGNDTFSEINAGLQGVESGSAAWGDYDNDGYLDILLCDSKNSIIYRNNCNGTFTDIIAALPVVSYSSVAWGDYNNDGKLDVLLTGLKGSERITKIFRNNTEISNNLPIAPVNLMSSIEGNNVTFSWTKSSDNETPVNGLSYNIYLGYSPAEGNLVNPMSDITYGYRKVIGLGNAGKVNSKTVKLYSSGTYYWGVQAIDNAYAGSLFSNGSSFTYTSPLPVMPFANEACKISQYSFTANWNSTGDKGYYIELAHDSIFTNFVNGYENVNTYNSLFYDFTGLESYQTYYYRLRSYNGDGIFSGYSNVIKIKTRNFPFVNIDTGLPGINCGSTAWGDYDNDGDLDILLTGYNGTTNISKIFRNDGEGNFTDINAGLPGIEYGSAKWGDYDNNGFLDILITGDTGTTVISRICQNNGEGNFTDINAGLIGVCYSSAAWGDYDNDGDLDILLTGYTKDEIISKIYQNNGEGNFTDINAGLIGVCDGSAVWGDYDNDGDLDILLTGHTGFGAISKIYRNNGNGSFSEIDAGLTGVYLSSVAWGDYDNDGDLDILLTGDTRDEKISKIYQNNGEGNFIDINAGLIGVCDGSAVWGDYDNDGLLDILLNGNGGEKAISKLYRNNGDASFTDIIADLSEVYVASSAWGDYNNDGKLDFILSGYTYSGNISKLYQNNTVASNSPPSSPSNLVSSIENGQVTLSWDKSFDNATTQDGLSYNVYIGDSSKTGNIMSPMSDAITGFRTIACLGNVNCVNSWTAKGLEPNTYYWSVQAIDHIFTGSEFSEEQVFTVTGIEDEMQPFITKLYQNYPNPFNPLAIIKYSIADDSHVKLIVYDIMGREIIQLVNCIQTKGIHEAKFKADNVTSGLYFYSLIVDNKVVSTKKMMMIK